ncbi:DUF6509 family protein [Paenibacillus sp. PK4536]|nr:MULTISPECIES: DUF6509 family protein [Paenibacillus]TKJ89811.1 pullulanase [Paenibacillus sp. CFBP13512]WIM41447.1 DUF6509 family protein [Paenibacillus sp. PK4536]
MMDITSYQVEMIKDPFEILVGKRYEFFIDFEVDEEDDIYSVNGLYIRAIYKVQETGNGIVSYDIMEKGTERVLDFDLEEEEEQELAAFCEQNWKNAESN